MELSAGGVSPVGEHRVLAGLGVVCPDVNDRRGRSSRTMIAIVVMMIVQSRGREKLAQLQTFKLTHGVFLQRMSNSGRIRSVGGTSALTKRAGDVLSLLGRNRTRNLTRKIF